MAKQYEELIAGFENKLRKLISEYESLRTENSSLKAEIVRRKEDQMHISKEFLELKAKYENVCIARSLSFSQKQKKVSRQYINSLICEVEKCIALLEK